jgi:ribosomal 50S subunit-recycling heat shock protein
MKVLSYNHQMRCDLFLKKVLLFKKRTEAKDMCNKNLIKLNGKYTKPSKTVSIDDTIEIETYKGVKKLKVLKIPSSNVRKNDITSYYEEL